MILSWSSPQVTVQVTSPLSSFGPRGSVPPVVVTSMSSVPVTAVTSFVGTPQVSPPSLPPVSGSA